MRRLPQTLLASAVVLAIIGTAIGGDAYTRREMEVIGQGEIARALSSELGEVSPDQVEIAIGGGSSFLQLALGTVDRVDVRVADMNVGAVRGDFNAQLFDLPTNRVQSIGRVSSYIEFDLDTIHALAEQFINGEVDSVTLQPPYVLVDTKIRLNSAAEKVPVTIAIDPVVRNGEIVLVVAFVSVGVIDYTPAELQAIEGVDPTTLLDTTGFCIASSIPAAMNVDDIRVSNGALVIVLGAQQLSVSDLTGAHGHCPN